jgi:hypothetical protein
MTNDIIDTQDGYCIWQTFVRFNGCVRAILHPVSEGVMNYGVIAINGNFLGLYKGYEEALANAAKHKAVVLPVTSGKFP